MGWARPVSPQNGLCHYIQTHFVGCHVIGLHPVYAATELRGTGEVVGYPWKAPFYHPRNAAETVPSHGITNSVVCDTSKGSL